MSKKISLSDIFKKTDVRNERLYEVVNGWNFKDLENFILSFENLTQNENIIFSKKYGNISKQLTAKILEEDCGNFSFDSNEKYDSKYILDFVKNKKELSENFKNLYEEISKRNQWKLEMPLVSLKYDFLLDRSNNDYERFNIVFPFLKKEESLLVKDLKKGKRTRISLKDLSSKEANEIEKIFYLLIRKINKKKDGEKFLKKHNVFKENNF